MGYLMDGWICVDHWIRIGRQPVNKVTASAVRVFCLFFLVPSVKILKIL